MKLFFTVNEGGQKLRADLHSLEWPDGLRWDEKNGFTRNYKTLGMTHVAPMVRDDIKSALKDIHFKIYRIMDILKID